MLTRTLAHTLFESFSCFSLIYFSISSSILSPSFSFVLSLTLSRFLSHTPHTHTATYVQPSSLVRGQHLWGLSHGQHLWVCPAVVWCNSFVSLLVVDNGGSGHGMVVVGECVVGGGGSSGACLLLLFVQIVRIHSPTVGIVALLPHFLVRYQHSIVLPPPATPPPTPSLLHTVCSPIHCKSA